MQTRPLPIITYRRKSAEDVRALRITRILRQVREGTYYVSGQEIAVKFMLHEQTRACSLT